MTTADALRLDRGAAIRRVLWWVLSLNLAVALLKLIAGIVAGSVAVRADGLHSLQDGLNNVILLAGARLASKPPDDGHPYGHRKFESLAVLAIGVALFSVAWDVLSDVTARFAGAHDLPRVDALTIAVLVVTLVANVFVSTWEAREGRRWQSPSLIADAAHTRSDIAVTTGVLLSTIATRAGVAWADAAAGAVVAGFIGFTAWRIVRDSVGILADAAALPVDKLTEAARAVAGVRDVRAVRSRGNDTAVFVDLVIHLDPMLSLGDAHDLAHAVEDEIRARFASVVDVQVHVEPSSPGPGRAG